MKKIISLLLIAAIFSAMLITAAAYSVYPDGKTSEQAVRDYEEANGVTVQTRRYYFQMPNGETGPLATTDVVYKEVDDETGEEKDIVVCHAGDHTPSWYNEFTEGAGVYWWGSAEANPDSWAGYKAMVADADQSIFYVDMPAKVVSFCWNNGVDGGTDKTQEIYYKAAYTIDIASEYPDPGEYASIPDGADSFDNMIVIIDPDSVDVNPLSHKMTCGYDWYFYYGDGCYGSYAQDSANFTGIEANCKNPDHFVDGVHVGFHGYEPDEPEEPAQPDTPQIPQTDVPHDAAIRVGGDCYPVSSGDTYTYEYRLNIGKRMTAIDATLSYDSDGLELVSVSFPKISSVETLEKSDCVRMSWFNNNGIAFDTDDSVLVRAEFKVKKTGGPYDIGLTIRDMSRYQEVRIVDDYEMLSDYSYKELIIDANDKSNIYLEADGKYYRVRPGKTYDYVYYLNAEPRIGSISAETHYNGRYLTFVPADKAAMFPVTGSGMSYYRYNYYSYYEYLSFNYRNASGALFIYEGSELLRLSFRVPTDVDDCVFSISTDISQLLDINEDEVDSYYCRGVIDGITPVERDPFEEPTEAPTEAPTQPEPTTAPTVAPTVAPTEVPTVAPTQPRPTTAPTVAPTEASTEVIYHPTEHWEYPTQYYPPSTGNTISFDANSAGWYGYRWVAFHIWGVNGDMYYDWGGKKQRGNDSDGDGVWTYDLDNAGIPMDGSQYVVIFYNDFGQMTYDLLFDSSCMGDTAYCTGEHIENPVDSNKSTQAAYWRHADPSVNGPELAITSIGNVVGYAVPQNTTRYEMFVTFLSSHGKEGLQNALYFTSRTAQQVIDDTASTLGLSKSDVERAITDAAVYGRNGEYHDWRNDWDSSKSTLPGGDSGESYSEDQYGYIVGEYYLLGSINGDNSWANDARKEFKFIKDTSDQMILSGVSLTKGDRVKVARYNGDRTFTWYPDGIGNAVEISATGVYTFYFKPYEIGNPNYWYLTPSAAHEPTAAPTQKPTQAATQKPTQAPSEKPSEKPSETPTQPAVKILLGDVDRDEEVSILDATAIQRKLAGLPVQSYDEAAADADQDGEVSILDATAIQRYLAGLPANKLIGTLI